MCYRTILSHLDQEKMPAVDDLGVKRKSLIGGARGEDGVVCKREKAGDQS